MVEKKHQLEADGITIPMLVNSRAVAQHERLLRYKAKTVPPEPWQLCERRQEAGPRVKARGGWQARLASGCTESQLVPPMRACMQADASGGW